MNDQFNNLQSNGDSSYCTIDDSSRLSCKPFSRSETYSQETPGEQVSEKDIHML